MPPHPLMPRCVLVGQGVRDRRASDRTNIDDSSQPNSVARFSHQSMSCPPRTCRSECQVDRWSSETSGTTVSIAYHTGLKQVTSPPPQESARVEPMRVPGLDTRAPAEVASRPLVVYTAPLPLDARSVAWAAGTSSETATITRRDSRSHRTRAGRYP